MKSSLWFIISNIFFIKVFPILIECIRYNVLILLTFLLFIECIRYNIVILLTFLLFIECIRCNIVIFIDLFIIYWVYKGEYCNTIDLLFYYLHTYVGIIYYHISFYFIKSINSKNKKRKFTMYNFLFETLLQNETKHNKVY